MHELAIPLLRHLADGEFHSGSVLADHFNVSRTTISSAVHTLSEHGLKIYSIRGRGYRLVGGYEPLESAAIEKSLPTRHPFHVQVADLTDSTNRQLLQQAASLPKGTALFAEYQTAGRGRRGRVWQAPPGACLTFSVLWRFEQGLEFLSGLSLAVGVAVVQALRALDCKEVALKWPNDILLHGRKLGGILIEMQGEATDVANVVIGIGLNLRLPPSLRQSLDQPAADLQEGVDAMPERNRVASTLLTHLARVLDAFAAQGFAAVRDDWSACHLYQDRPVRLLHANGSVIEGIARGVAPSGALLLETAQGIQTYTSGDVSLRGG